MERTVLVDDRDGTIAESVRTRPLALDDEVISTIDLTEENRELLREELQQAVERFIAKARPEAERAETRVAAKLRGPKVKVGGKSHLSKKQRAEREQLNAIREWARKRGYQVSDYGKIPAAVMEAFQSLHGTPQNAPQPRLTAVTRPDEAEEKLFSNAS